VYMVSRFLLLILVFGKLLRPAARNRGNEVGIDHVQLVVIVFDDKELDIIGAEVLALGRVAVGEAEDVDAIFGKRVWMAHVKTPCGAAFL
jgi:hypothetical protein